MLRERNSQLTIWDPILPPQVLKLPEELEAIDKILDTEEFFEPFRRHFSLKAGRPSVPIETYIRLMYLKFRYGFGYETLIKEVSDSFSWKRFCRIPLEQEVPHSTTLIKITKRCGEEAVAELNRALLKKLSKNKVLRTRKVRVDSTVTDADIEYPTDASLLAKSVNSISKLLKRISSSTGAKPPRNRTRSVKKKLKSLSLALKKRSEDKLQRIEKLTGEIMGLTQKTLKEANIFAANTSQSATGFVAAE